MTDNDSDKVIETELAALGIAGFEGDIMMALCRELVRGGAGSANLFHMANMLEADAMLLRTAIEERGDISPEDLDHMSQRIKVLARTSEPAQTILAILQSMRDLA